MVDYFSPRLVKIKGNKVICDKRNRHRFLKKMRALVDRFTLCKVQMPVTFSSKKMCSITREILAVKYL